MPQALGQGFSTNPLPCSRVARGCPGGRPPGMAADTRISNSFDKPRNCFFFSQLNFSGLFLTTDYEM